jgi:hypothetical protein
VYGEQSGTLNFTEIGSQVHSHARLPKAAIVMARIAQ